MYQCKCFASNDHRELQEQVNAWLQQQRPTRVHQIEMVADGAEFTYVVLAIYVVAGKKS